MYIYITENSYSITKFNYFTLYSQKKYLKRAYRTKFNGRYLNIQATSRMFIYLLLRFRVTQSGTKSLNKKVNILEKKSHKRHALKRKFFSPRFIFNHFFFFFGFRNSLNKSFFFFSISGFYWSAEFFGQYRHHPPDIKGFIPSNCS